MIEEQEHPADKGNRREGKAESELGDYLGAVLRYVLYVGDMKNCEYQGYNGDNETKVVHAINI
ncbi:hypothetical protein [Methylomagnum sp.]